jgi:D-glycero-D-manno-heptose 1,7-bisphosphate phosphatase
VNGRWSTPSERRPLTFLPVGASDRASGRPAAFLDRDGVLNEGVPDPVSGALESPLTVEDVRLLPGAAAAVGTLVQAGFAAVCVSNQPAAAKGKTTLEGLKAVHERVLELLAREGAQLEFSLLCPCHPEGVVPGLSGACDCRKPAPGMLLDATEVLSLDLGASWILGDTDVDVQAGQAAGCRTVLIEYPGSAHKRLGHATPDLLAADLPAAAAQLLTGDIADLRAESHTP